MKNNQQIVPSLLSFNKNDWGYYFILFQHANLEYIHFDVMDKDYVGNTAYNEKDFHKFIHIHNNLKAHVHLMVMDPLNEVEKYFHKKTDAICFHFDVYENQDMVFECLEKIKKAGIKAGIAINPNFAIWYYEQYLQACDFITLMGVFPGKAGQKFEISCLQNLKELKEWSQKNHKEFLIEIDGGMNFDTIPLVLKDSQYLVSGSFLAKNINKLQEITTWMENLEV